jgi:hypothetical protein
MLLADLALHLGLGDEAGDGVDHHHRHLPRADQDVGHLEGLLPALGAAEQHPVGIDPGGGRPGEVEGVLGVDEHPGPAGPLGLGEDRQGQGGLADTFGAVDLGDPPAGQATDTEGLVQGQAAGRDHRRWSSGGAVGVGEDRGTELLGDGGQGGLEAPVTLLVGVLGSDGRGSGHASSFP